MGLFSGLAKLAGKVIKTGLSVATGGKSDAVLKVVKGVTGLGKPKAKPAMTAADAASILKYEAPAKAKVVSGAMPGLAPALRTVAPRKPRKPKKPKKAKAPKAPSTRRAPSGGLDLKKISALWSAAGKPGRWVDFVKANANVRKG